MMTKEEKNKLKEKLPTKWVAALIEATGFSEPYIRKVMSGERSHLTIEREALKLAQEYQKDVQKLEELKESVL